MEKTLFSGEFPITVDFELPNFTVHVSPYTPSEFLLLSRQHHTRFPILCKSISSLKKVQSKYVAVSPLFSKLYSLEEGDLVSVKRFDSRFSELTNVILSPFKKLTSQETKKTMEIIPKQKNVACEGGAIVIQGLFFKVLSTKPNFQGIIRETTDVVLCSSPVSRRVKTDLSRNENIPLLPEHTNPSRPSCSLLDLTLHIQSNLGMQSKPCSPKLHQQSPRSNNLRVARLPHPVWFADERNKTLFEPETFQKMKEINEFVKHISNEFVDTNKEFDFPQENEPITQNENENEKRGGKSMPFQHDTMHNIGGVTVNTLKRLGLFNESIVGLMGPKGLRIIRLMSLNSPAKKFFTTINPSLRAILNQLTPIFTFKKLEQKRASIYWHDDTVYLPPYVSFNMGVYSKHFPTTYLRPVTLQPSFLPTIAQSAVIALVTTHHNPISALCDFALHSYFQVPRLVHTGDIIAVPIPATNTVAEIMKKGLELPFPPVNGQMYSTSAFCPYCTRMLHFKVVELKSADDSTIIRYGFISRKETKLTLTLPLQSRLPCGGLAFACEASVYERINQGCPSETLSYLPLPGAIENTQRLEMIFRLIEYPNPDYEKAADQTANSNNKLVEVNSEQIRKVSLKSSVIRTSSVPLPSTTIFDEDKFEPEREKYKSHESSSDDEEDEDSEESSENEHTKKKKNEPKKFTFFSSPHLRKQPQRSSFTKAETLQEVLEDDDIVPDKLSDSDSDGIDNTHGVFKSGSTSLFVRQRRNSFSIAQRSFSPIANAETSVNMNRQTKRSLSPVSFLPHVYSKAQENTTEPKHIYGAKRNNASIHPKQINSHPSSDTSQTILNKTSADLNPLSNSTHAPIYNSLSSSISVAQTISASLPTFGPLPLPLPPAVYTALLVGEKGVGRRHSVRAAAQAAGVHMIKVECSALIETNEAAIETSLFNVFQNSLKFSPSVLVLEGIDILDHVSLSEGAIKSTRKDSIFARAFSDFISTYFPPSSAEHDRETQRQKKQHRKNSFHQTMTVPLSSDYLPNDPHSDYCDPLPYKLAIVATTTREEELSPKTRNLFTHVIEYKSPNVEQRLQMLKRLSVSMGLSADVPLMDLAINTASFVWKDIKTVVQKASFHAMLDNYKKPIQTRAVGYSVSWSHVSKALKEMHERQASIVGRPKIPTVHWSDIGGLETAKRELMKALSVPLLPKKHKNSAESTHTSQTLSLVKGGVLFYGPPGTGKTLLAKAAATELAYNFLSVKGPELVNMYVGESERNVREIFRTARSAAPCIIFFDELDSLAPRRGHGSDGGSVMERVVAQLLSELDSSSRSENVFVIGATNRPDLIDPALLSPGRFEKLIYLGIPESDTACVKILQALTKNFRLDSDVNFEDVVNCAPSHNQMTGADWYSLAADAFTKAAHEVIERKEKDEITSREEMFENKKKKHSSLLVSQRHFLDAAKNICPSVSAAELAKFKEVQSSFQ